MDEEKADNPEDESIAQVSQAFEQVILLLGQTFVLTSSIKQ